MRLKHAIHQGRKAGIRYIQRMQGNTIFDLVKYQPDHMDLEDLRSDDWMIPAQSPISYLNKTGRKAGH